MSPRVIQSNGKTYTINNIDTTGAINILITGLGNQITCAAISADQQYSQNSDSVRLNLPVANLRGQPVTVSVQPPDNQVFPGQRAFALIHFPGIRDEYSLENIPVTVIGASNLFTIRFAEPQTLYLETIRPEARNDGVPLQGFAQHIARRIRDRHSNPQPAVQRFIRDDSASMSLWRDHIAHLEYVINEVYRALDWTHPQWSDANVGGRGNTLPGIGDASVPSTVNAPSVIISDLPQATREHATPTIMFGSQELANYFDPASTRTFVISERDLESIDNLDRDQDRLQKVTDLIYWLCDKEEF